MFSPSDVLTGLRLRMKRPPSDVSLLFSLLRREMSESFSVGCSLTWWSVLGRQELPIEPRVWPARQPRGAAGGRHEEERHRLAADDARQDRAALTAGAGGLQAAEADAGAVSGVQRRGAEGGGGRAGEEEPGQGAHERRERPGVPAVRAILQTMRSKFGIGSLIVDCLVGCLLMQV